MKIRMIQRRQDTYRLITAESPPVLSRYDHTKRVKREMDGYISRFTHSEHKLMWGTPVPNH